MDTLKDFYDFYRPLQRRYDLRMFYKTNSGVERWFERYDDKQGEYLECSMKDNIDNFYAEFVIIENGEIVKFISSREFEY